MALSRTLSLALLSFALGGCGRLGFEPQKHTVQDPPTAEDAGDGPSDDAGSVPDAGHEPDAGSQPGKDKPVLDPVDAGELPSGDPDAGAPGGDGGSDGGGVLPPQDAGAMPAPPDDAGLATFACTDYTNTLGCWDFSGTRPSGWSITTVTGDADVSRHDGYVDAMTWSVPADAYARLEFENQYSGTLYFRMRVMFPSDGDLTSVNFLTVGNYQDDSDYGIELDAIDGRLAFNSSYDGFTYTDFVLERDVWLCIDASLRLARYGNMSVRVDGQAALDVSDVDTVPSAGTDIAHMGIDWTRRYQEFGHVLVDDFVLSHEPVTCP